MIKEWKNFVLNAVNGGQTTVNTRAIIEKERGRKGMRATEAISLLESMFEANFKILL